MVTIFDYSNYREYLKDYYLQKKSERNGFTYALFSELAGLKSPNYLKLIIDSKKNLTSANVIKFANALKLQNEEIDYFEALVRFNQSKSHQEREFHLKKLTRLKNMVSNDHGPILKSQLESEIIKNWKYYAVIMLTNLSYFKDSPEWISKKLYGLISAEEAGVILKNLIASGLLQKDSRGVIVSTSKNIKSSDDLQSSSDKQFYEDVLKRAENSLSVADADELSLSTSVVNISINQLPEMRKKIRNCMAELSQLAMENSRPDRVYSVMLCTFPLSTKEEFREDMLWN